MSIRFDGQVAIVTGAGGGLGRQHALALAARGAKVVVNDFGRAAEGQTMTAAEAVVREIEAAGGTVVEEPWDVEVRSRGQVQIRKDILDHQFAAPIWVRCVSRAVLAENIALAIAIHRGRRREDEGLYLRPPHGCEHLHAAMHIVVVVLKGLLH